MSSRRSTRGGDNEDEDEEDVEMKPLYNAPYIEEEKTEGSILSNEDDDDYNDEDEGEEEEEEEDDPIGEDEDDETVDVVDPVSGDIVPMIRPQEIANSYLRDQDFALDYNWKLFWRMAPVVFVFSLIVVILSWLTGMIFLVWAFLIIFFVTGMGLIIVSIFKWYTLLFFFFVYALAAMGYIAFQMITMLPNVYVCNSSFCNHGKKWLFTTNWIFLFGFVGLFSIMCRNCLVLLSGYRDY